MSRQNDPVTGELLGAAPHRGGAATILCAPVSRQAWTEILYVLVGVPLAVAGFFLAVAGPAFGVALSLTFIGLPLIGLSVLGARGFGIVQRGLARRVLGIEVAAPEPFRSAPGFLGWLSAALGDATGWRAIVYLLVKLPLAVLGLGVVGFFWAEGLFGLFYPVLWGLDVDRPAPSIAGISFDSWPRILLVPVVGLATVLVAPWLVHLVLMIDRLAMRGLLGPTRQSERVRDLEQTRAHAVDDAAATLRRIERDLHDGAQARLVALAMRLSMAKENLAGETVDDDAPALDVARARALVDAAHRDAKEAIVEVRDLARGIHPPVLDRGLDAALTTLGARSAIPVDVRVHLPDRPSASIETIAYFCAAELLANVTRHSGARNAIIEASLTDGRLRVRVTDDGAGGARVGGGSGLAGLTDRVRTVDGRLEIDSPHGGPTVITVDLPSHP